MKLPFENSGLDIKFRVNGSGQVEVNMDYHPGSKDVPLIPKFGTRLAIPRMYDNIEWYGRGPFENYQDRETAALTGIYDRSLDEFVVPYISSQDNANRTGTR